MQLPEEEDEPEQAALMRFGRRVTGDPTENEELEKEAANVIWTTELLSQEQEVPLEPGKANKAPHGQVFVLCHHRKKRSVPKSNRNS